MTLLNGVQYTRCPPAACGNRIGVACAETLDGVPSNVPSATGAQRELYESIRVAAHADVRRQIKTRGLAGSTIAKARARPKSYALL